MHTEGQSPSEGIAPLATPLVSGNLLSAACCEKCGRTRAEMKCHLDIYNDFDDEPGNLICDGCVYAEAMACDKRTGVALPVRPEGYYHAPIGTFD